MKDLRRFQEEKENDLRRYMVGEIRHLTLVIQADMVQMEFAQCHIDWARRSQAAWEEAKVEVEAIQPHVEE